MALPPASPGPASAGLELAEGGPAGVVSCQLWRNGRGVVAGPAGDLLADDGPANQLSQDGEGIEDFINRFGNKIINRFSNSICVQRISRFSTRICFICPMVQR